MFEPQNISAPSSSRADAGVVGASRPRDSLPKVKEPTSFRGDDSQEQRPEQKEAARQQPEQTAKSPRARLHYSLTESDAYVEILNPQTGDVIKRFPPEQAEDQLRSFAEGDAGVFLNKVA